MSKVREQSSGTQHNNMKHCTMCWHALHLFSVGPAERGSASVLLSLSCSHFQGCDLRFCADESENETKMISSNRKL